MPIIKLFKKVYKEIPFLIMVTCLIMSIIKLFKNVYKEFPFLIIITCSIISINKLFKKLYKEIPKGNSILTNDHMFKHSYYY